jgi:hypothetical protein
MPKKQGTDKKSAGVASAFFNRGLSSACDFLILKMSPQLPAMRAARPDSKDSNIAARTAIVRKGFPAYGKSLRFSGQAVGAG